MRSDDLRGKQFSTHRRGYDETQVGAFLEAAGLRLAAMESTDRPAGPLVSDATLVAWAEWADSTTFSKLLGYSSMEVDAFREKVRDTFLGATRFPVRADKVRGKQFSTDDDGYDKKQVGAFLEAAGLRLAAMESTERPAGPLVSGAIHAGSAKWADSTRFSTTPRRGWGYATAEVDAFRQEIRDTFLGVRQPLLTSDEARDKRFTLTRQGYKLEQVDAFFDQADQRLAAMRPTDKGRRD